MSVELIIAAAFGCVAVLTVFAVALCVAAASEDRAMREALRRRLADEQVKTGLATVGDQAGAVIFEFPRSS